jgi:hypothetical protein
MSISFQIIRDRGVVLARLSGQVRIEECVNAAAAYARHPETRPTQPVLIDLTAVTGYETDYVKILQAMARLPEYLWHRGTERLLVCLAPHALSRQISAAAARAILEIPEGIARIAQTEADALEILGLPERRLCDLSQGSARNR